MGGEALRFADDKLKNDKDIISEAINQNGFSFGFNYGHALMYSGNKIKKIKTLL